MLFIFKNKKITVDCFTPLSYVYEYAQIKKSSNFYPDWWKNLPKNIEIEDKKSGITRKGNTIKTCNGLIDLYSNSLTIPMWSDLIIEYVGDGYNYLFSDEKTSIQNHNERQYQSEEFSNFLHGKIVCPWFLKEKSGVKFTMIQPMWNQLTMLKHFHVVPGTLDLSYAGTQTNINFFIEKGENYRLKFSHGDPIAQLIPQTHKDIEIKSHLISDQEYKYLSMNSGTSIKFNGKHKRHKQILNERKSKCPFH